MQATEKTWLIVEDDTDHRIMMSAITAYCKRTPLAFKDGYQAMAWLDEVAAGTATDPLPELALLDIRMPGPQGPEIAQRMRNLPSTVHIPIIMMTAFRFDTAEADKIERLARPNKLMSKPLPGPDELKEVFESVIRTSQPQEAT